MNQALALIMSLALSAPLAGAGEPEVAVTVATTLPLATAEAVESTVTVPLEAARCSQGGFNSMRSRSAESQSYIEVYVYRSTSEMSLRRIASVVQGARTSLPREAHAPIVGLRAVPVLR
jgi:multidrug efflux pump subunit AcrB